MTVSPVARNSKQATSPSEVVGCMNRKQRSAHRRGKVRWTRGAPHPRGGPSVSGEAILANVTVIGGQWGDEGKGKIVDWLASRADVVVRFQGGHNAGHTLVVGDQTYKLSLLPSGIVRGTLSVIGNGVVLDPWALRTRSRSCAEQGVVDHARTRCRSPTPAR